MPADFADASLVALAERRNLSRVASFDRDFAVYRTLGKRAFTKVFFGDWRLVRRILPAKVCAFAEFVVMVLYGELKKGALAERPFEVAALPRRSGGVSPT